MSKQDSNTKTLEDTDLDSDKEAEIIRSNFLLKRWPNLMSKEEQIRANFLLKQLEGVPYPKSDETLKNGNYNNNNGYFSKDYDTFFTKLVPIVGEPSTSKGRLLLHVNNMYKQYHENIILDDQKEYQNLITYYPEYDLERISQFHTILKNCDWLDDFSKKQLLTIVDTLENTTNTIFEEIKQGLENNHIDKKKLEKMESWIWVQLENLMTSYLNCLN